MSTLFKLSFVFESVNFASVFDPTLSCELVSLQFESSVSEWKRGTRRVVDIQGSGSAVFLL